MTSLILRSATRRLTPLILFFSLFLLLQGHDAPGGGFVGGLTAAAAFVLHGVAFGTRATLEALRIAPIRIAGAGLVIALVACFVPLLGRKSFLAGWWGDLPVGRGGVQVGSPLLFDLGVYVLVIGTALTVIFSVAEARPR